jgi:hypothetical protein
LKSTNRTYRKLALLAALFSPAVITTKADANLFKKITKTATKTTKTVASGTTQAAKTVATGATQAGKTVAAEASSVINGDEAKTLSATAKKSYEAAVKEGESAYRQSMSAVQAGIDAAKKAALQAAAQEYLRKYKGFLVKLRSNIDALAKDEAATNVVDRVVKAAAEKRLDDQTRADLQFLGERLGLLDWKPGSIVPGSSGGALKSSWGILVGGGAAYVGGAEGSFGLVANCYKETDQRYGAGLLVSVGGLVGIAFGGSVDVMFFWQPGGVSDSEGGQIGLGVEGAVGGIGGTLGIQWNVSEGMKGASAGIPGFYLGWAGGAKVKAGALEGGYTWVPVKSTK